MSLTNSQCRSHEYQNIDRESMFLPVGTSDMLDPGEWLHFNDCLIEEVVRNWKGDQHQLQCDFRKSAPAHSDKQDCFLWIYISEHSKIGRKLTGNGLHICSQQFMFIAFHISSFPALRHCLVLVDLMIGIIYLQH